MLWRARRKWSSLLAAFFVPILILAQQPHSRGSEAKLTPEQVVALSTKPAVVRIENACAAGYKYKDEDGKEISGFATYGSAGSGFFVNPNGYIVTYAVKNKKDCQTQLSKKAADLEGVSISSIVIEDEDVQYISNVYLPQPEESSQQPFKIEKSGSEGISLIRVPIKNAPVLKLTNEPAQLQDQISAIGYPIAADTGNLTKDNFDNPTNGLSKEAFSEASVTGGRISNPNKTLQDKSPVLQVDVQSGPGSAGGPIVNSDGEVVGMIAPTSLDLDFYSTGNNSASEPGVPLAIPASTIQEFLQSTGVKNEQGRTDFLFHEGLMSFVQGDYQDAKIKFEAVKDLFSDHSEVDRLISQSNELLVDQVKEPPYLFYGGIAAAVLGLLGLIFFLLRRKPSTAKKTATGAVPLTLHSNSSRNNRLTSVDSSSVDYSQPYLELEFQGKSCYLTLKGDEHRIGRDTSWSDVEIPENWEVISRHHAILRKEGNSYRIYDGDGITPSSNGLLRKDNTKVDMRGDLLRNGDEFRIGKNPREQVVATYFDPASSRTNIRPTRMAE